MSEEITPYLNMPSAKYIGQCRELHIFTVPNPLHGSNRPLTCGTHNGYVYFPWIKDIKGLDDMDGYFFADEFVRVHGGWTFYRDGFLGFDTAHAYDGYQDEDWVIQHLKTVCFGLEILKNMLIAGEV